MKKKLIPKHQSGNVIKQHNNLYFPDGSLFSIEGFSPNELQAMSNANQGQITEDNKSPQKRFTDNLVGDVKAQLEGKKRVSPYLAYPMAGLAATSIFNPITSLKALGSLATKGAVVDVASNILTGKNYGQAVGDLLDINPEVANFINPAFLPWSKPYNYTVGRLLPKTKIGQKARAKLISQAIDRAPQKYFGSVKYYGPTMGKTTASKYNPDVIDFDAIAREETEKLAAKHGVTKQQLQISPRLEQEYRNMLNRLVEQWRTNPENTNKMLLISKKVLANEPYYDNIPSIPDRATFIQRQIQRGEQYPSRASDYYDALQSANPNLKIENRFVSDMEGNPHYISVEPETKAGIYPFGDKEYAFPTSLMIGKFAGTTPEMYKAMNARNFTPYYIAYPGEGNKALGQETIRRLSAFFNPDTPYIGLGSTDKPITPRKAIENAAKRPVILGRFPEGSDLGGFYSRLARQSAIEPHGEITPYSIYHENNMHGTDDVIEAVTPQIKDMYQQFVDEIYNGIIATPDGKIVPFKYKDDMLPITDNKSARHWYELRATLGELMRKFYYTAAEGKGYKGIKDHLDELRPLVEKGIDNMKDDDLVNTLRRINAYGNVYGYLGPKTYPNFFKDLRWMLKNAPVTTGITYGITQNDK